MLLAAATREYCASSGTAIFSRKKAAYKPVAASTHRSRGGCRCLYLCIWSSSARRADIRRARAVLRQRVDALQHAQRATLNERVIRIAVRRGPRGRWYAERGRAPPAYARSAALGKWPPKTRRWTTPYIGIERIVTLSLCPVIALYSYASTNWRSISSRLSRAGPGDGASGAVCSTVSQMKPSPFECACAICSNVSHEDHYP